MIATFGLKQFGMALLGCWSSVIGWYAQSRLLADHRCTHIVHIDAPERVSSPKTTLRVATFNLAHGRGGTADGSNWTGESRQQKSDRLSEIASQIRDADVDMVLLNEVDFAAPWSGYVNQARFIAETAGFQVCVEQRNYDLAFPFVAIRFGNALLSRHPVSEVRLVRFPPLSRLEAMLAGNHDGMVATVHTPLGDVRVLAVHLDSRSEDVRVRCARVISREVSQSSLPWIVMGDFNSAPRHARGHCLSASNENAMDILLSDHQATSFDSALDWFAYLTFPSQEPAIAIDWILCSPALRLGSPQIVHSALSDHLMVLAEAVLRLATEPSVR